MQIESLLLVFALIGLLLAHWVRLTSHAPGRSRGRPTHNALRDTNFNQHRNYSVAIQELLLDRPKLFIRTRMFLYSLVWSFRVFAVSVAHRLKNKSQIPIHAIRQVVARIEFGRGILQS